MIELDAKDGVGGASECLVPRGGLALLGRSIQQLREKGVGKWLK